MLKVIARIVNQTDEYLEANYGFSKEDEINKKWMELYKSFNEKEVEAVIDEYNNLLVSGIGVEGQPHDFIFSSEEYEIIKEI